MGPSLTRLPLFCLLVILLHTSLSSSFSSFCTDSEWELVWEEQFEGTTLNTSRWTPTLGYNIGEGRDAYLTADNCYVEDGHLVLRSQRPKSGPYNFTSGAITTKGKAAWKYGRVCVRARLPGGGPPGAGDGVWPAHWMMPNDSSCWPDHGEIDILEMINGDSQAHGTYHWNRFFPKTPCIGAKGDTAVTGHTRVDAWSSQYHEYATEWGKDYIQFFVDGKMYVNITTSSHGTPGNGPPQFPPSPMYMILNTAVGGPYVKPVTNKTVFPTYHLVDYVRVAQRRL